MKFPINLWPRWPVFTRPGLMPIRELKMMSIADRIQRAYELEHRVPSDRLTPRVLHHESLILGSRRDLMKTMELVESDNLTST